MAQTVTHLENKYKESSEDSLDDCSIKVRVDCWFYVFLPDWVVMWYKAVRLTNDLVSAEQLQKFSMWPLCVVILFFLNQNHHLHSWHVIGLVHSYTDLSKHASLEWLRIQSHDATRRSIWWFSRPEISGYKMILSYFQGKCWNFHISSAPSPPFFSTWMNVIVYIWLSINSIHMMLLPRIFRITDPLIRLDIWIQQVTKTGSHDGSHQTFAFLACLKWFIQNKDSRRDRTGSQYSDTKRLKYATATAKKHNRDIDKVSE